MLSFEKGLCVAFELTQTSQNSSFKSLLSLMLLTIPLSNHHFTQVIMIDMSHLAVKLADGQDLCCSVSGRLAIGTAWVFTNAVQASCFRNLSDNFGVWAWALCDTVSTLDKESEFGTVHVGDRYNSECHVG